MLTVFCGFRRVSPFLAFLRGVESRPRALLVRGLLERFLHLLLLLLEEKFLLLLDLAPFLLLQDQPLLFVHFLEV